MIRSKVIAKLAPQLADFMNDSYGRVVRNGGRWTATDGGAQFSVSSLSDAEAEALDTAARKFAYADDVLLPSGALRW